MYQFLSSTQVISRSLVMVFFWALMGPYVPNTGIWWCLQTGGGGVVTGSYPTMVEGHNT